MNDQPLVSVLMTAYNREKYIAEAIESILASTYTNFELIVVDDCSKDSTVAIARRYAALDSRIKVFVNERNLGDYPNRNKAASYARGEYLKYVDSDDYIYPHTLSVMLSAIEQFPDAGFGISSRTKSEVTFFNPERAYRCHFFERGLLDLGPTATIIRRNIFEEMGGFKMIRNVSDFDFGFEQHSATEWLK